MAPAKILKDAIKKYKKCEIKGGVINGVVSDADAMNTLADLPPRDVLIARLLGSMMSPISGLAIVLDQIARRTAKHRGCRRSVITDQIFIGGYDNGYQ